MSGETCDACLNSHQHGGDGCNHHVKERLRSQLATARGLLEEAEKVTRNCGWCGQGTPCETCGKLMVPAAVPLSSLYCPDCARGGTGQRQP